MSFLDILFGDKPPIVNRKLSTELDLYYNPQYVSGTWSGLANTVIYPTDSANPYIILDITARNNNRAGVFRLERRREIGGPVVIGGYKTASGTAHFVSVYDHFPIIRPREEYITIRDAAFVAGDDYEYTIYYVEVTDHD
jgi:hypothetical protein